MNRGPKLLNETLVMVREKPQCWFTLEWQDMFWESCATSITETQHSRL